MKKKFLIGGGITALVAAIVVIVVLAQGGNYFQGSTFEDLLDSKFDLTYEGPDYYVNANRSDACDSGALLGSKNCPF